jgi:hypothetical protein
LETNLADLQHSTAAIADKIQTLTAHLEQTEKRIDHLVVEQSELKRKWERMDEDQALESAKSRLSKGEIRSPRSFQSDLRSTIGSLGTPRKMNPTSPLLNSSVSIRHKPGSELNGIIAFLSRRCGGNVCDKGVVGVFGQPHRDILAVAAKNIVDLSVDSRFVSVDAPNQSIGFDFKRWRIKPTHYTIRSHFYAEIGGPNLKSWVIEGSMDGSEWTEMDRRIDNSDLNDRNATRTFRLARSEECKFMRLRQIGKNHSGNDVIVISSFEVFGTLIDSRRSDTRHSSDGGENSDERLFD